MLRRQARPKSLPSKLAVSDCARCEARLRRRRSLARSHGFSTWRSSLRAKTSPAIASPRSWINSKIDSAKTRCRPCRPRVVSAPQGFLEARERGAGDDLSSVVYDHFQTMRDNDRYELGTFDSPAAAIEAAKSLIEGELLHLHKPGMSADELLDLYGSFGESPAIWPSAGEPEVPFDYRSYAREYAQRLAHRGRRICKV